MLVTISRTINRKMVSETVSYASAKRIQPASI